MVADPEPDPAGSWEFHDGTGPFAGWLYRHADGALVTEDGTVLEEEAPPAEPDETPVQEPPEPAATPEERVEEPTPSDELDESPEEAAAQRDDEPTPPAEPPAESPGESTEAPVPAYLRWEANAAPQYLAGLVFVVAAVGAVLLLFGYLAEADTGRLVTAAGLALLAGAALWAIDAASPSVVTLRGSTLTVERGEASTDFDLADAATQVALEGSPGRPTWRARLTAPSGAREVLRRTDVDPRQLTSVVRQLRP